MTEVKSISKIIEGVTKQKEPFSTHNMVYDSSSETLEPIYFFLLDLMNDMGLGTEKLIDNFTSTPGSGHFAELGQRATIMQQQASKIMGDINTVLRSVLNIIYDLKDFRIRLQHYDKLKSKDEREKEAARLALKQIWMDKVDITKGNSSIKAMAMQGGFQTLIHAFLSVNDVKEVDKIDLNDVVKRILRPRVQEFNIWVEQSGEELKKRYELEKTYLRSQVNSLKLYSRWVKPYLVAAQQLEMKESGRNPALVKTFNTIFLELTLLGKRALKIEDEIGQGNLSKDIGNERKLRKYYSCILIDFTFRGIPQRVTQQPHYTFGGRTEVSFKSYVMNEDELAKFEEEISQSEIEEVLKLIEGTTAESIGKLQEDINFFLEEKTEKEKKRGFADTSNPFFAILGKYNDEEYEHSEKKSGEKASVIIRPESFFEKEYLRKLAGENAKLILFTLFDVYKKAHGMPSYT